MKKYITSCQNCDAKVTVHVIAETTKRGFLLKCTKCGKVSSQSHTKTFLKNREIQ